MNAFDTFRLQLDLIKRDLRVPFQTFSKRDQANPRNRLSRPVEPANIDPGASYHGSAYGYKSKRCRCERCTRANTDAGRFYKNKHRVVGPRLRNFAPQPSLFLSMEGR